MSILTPRVQALEAQTLASANQISNLSSAVAGLQSTGNLITGLSFTAITPVTVATGTGTVSWTTANANGWPSSSKLVYVEVVFNLANNAGGVFQVRQSSSAIGFSICGTVSANNISGNTAGVGFVPVTSAGSFDYQSTSADAWTLRVLGYWA